MIWHKLLGRTPPAIRRIPNAPQNTPCGSSTLELTELEERILMSATPLAPDALPDADVDEPVDTSDASPDAAHEAPATELGAHDASAGTLLSDAATADESLEDVDVTADSRHEIAFVDTSLTGYQELLAHLADQQDDADNLDVVLLNGQEDGIEQITRALEQYEQLDAIHFLSHGTDGSVKLGNTWLDADHLTAYAGAIAGWSDALASEADILFYSCDLAASPDGLTLLDAIHALTGADVAASVDATGHTGLSGDWDLEQHIGSIETFELLTPEAREQWFRIMSSAYVRDDFDTLDFTGNDGSANWTGNWQEIGESDGAGSGKVQVLSRDLGSGTTNCLQLDSASGRGAYRELDLSSATSAAFSYSYRRENLSGVTLDIQVSDDGGSSWTSLNTFGAGNDATPVSASHDVTSYAALHTQVRFVINGGGSGAFFIDYVQVEYETGALPANNAPVLNSGDALTLSDILEDQSASAGSTVASILASAGDDRITDADTSALEGIAVTGVDNTHGQWQYDADATGNWQAFGTVSNNSAVLLGADSLVRFVPTAEFSGSAGQIQFRAWDQTSGGVGDTGCDVSTNGSDTAFSTAIDSASITVTAANDAPELTLPGSQSVSEDTALTISGVSVADVDSDTADLQVTLGVGHGQLTLGTTTGLTFSTGDGTADPTLVFKGALADINAALATLTYRADANYAGADAVGVTVSDLGNTGTGGALSDSGSVDLTIAAVNDAPQLTLPADLSVDEDTDLAISGLCVADDSGAADIRVTLTADHGRLTLGTTTGLTFLLGDGTADPTLVFKGSLTDVNAALATLTYRGALNYNGADAVNVTVNDLGSIGSGTAQVAGGSVDLTVLAVNDAPMTTGLGVVKVDEDAANTHVDLFAAFDDVEQQDSTLEYTIVDVSNQAFFDAVVIDQDNGWLILDYASNMFGSSAITVCVRDAEGQFVTDVLSVTIHPVNDAPVSSPNGYTVRGDEVLVVGAPGLLGNDTDVDGDTLTARLVRAPYSGNLTLNADGSFTYEPNPSYTGIVTFAYRATDGDASSERTLVIIKVTAATTIVELDADTPDDTAAADDTTTPQASESTAAAAANSFNLQALTNAELPSNVAQGNQAPTRVHDPQQTHGQEMAADAAVVNLGQGLGSASVDEEHGHRAAARGRSSDESVDVVVAFVETVTLPAAPEVIAPVITVAQHEMADLSTLLVDNDLFHRWMIGSAVGVTTGLTVGYVFWTVRAGYLLTGLVAQVPAWRFVDPLPILNSLGGAAAQGDGESLASIAQAGSGETAA